MPVNMRTHAHGQGYTDLNFLIPELVARIDYRKGPYYADEGDFASAGAADIWYAESLPNATRRADPRQLRLRAGAAAGRSPEFAGGRLVYGLELFAQRRAVGEPRRLPASINGVLR